MIAKTALRKTESSPAAWDQLTAAVMAAYEANRRAGFEVPDLDGFEIRTVWVLSIERHDVDEEDAG